MPSLEQLSIPLLSTVLHAHKKRTKQTNTRNRQVSVSTGKQIWSMLLPVLLHPVLS